MDDPNRRPVAARRLGLLRGTARWLAGRGVSANRISQASIVFAALGFCTFWATTALGLWWQSAAFVAAALAIQLRLLCNLIDGLVAVEGGQATPEGAFWNEAPDRVADVLFFGGAGLAAGWASMGLGCAVLALATAYLREFGRAEGLAPDFGGPMAKQHRMAALTAGAVLAALLPVHAVLVMMVTLVLIAAGTLVTVVLRAGRVLGALADR